MEELLKLTKQSLSIVETATFKDEEIKMWIEAAIEDLQRMGINVAINTQNALLKAAIIMFVKANFGNVEIKEKELAKKTYSLLCNNMSLSLDYKGGDSND